MALSNKQRRFAEEYLKCYNATQAAIKAGYPERSAYSQGSRLLKNAEVDSYVRTRLQETAMQADEVMMRLAEHARGDIMALLDPATLTLDFEKAKANGATRLIKKIKQTVVTSGRPDGSEQQTEILEVELHDAQAALVHIGRHEKLFTDKTDLTSDGKPITVTFNPIPERDRPPD